MVTLQRVGVSVVGNAVRAVGIDRGVVTWVAKRDIVPGEGMESAVTQVLQDIPRSRWRMPRLVVSLGPARSQTRRIEGLPPVPDARTVTAIVRSNPTRFFLRNGVPIVTGDAVPGDEGAWFAAAFEAPAIAALVTASRAARLPLEAIVPALAARALTTRGEVECLEDESIVRATGTVNGLGQVQRAFVPGSAELDSPAQLASLGAEAVEFVDSYAAAMVPLENAPCYRPQRHRPDTMLPRWRTAVSLAVLVAGALILLLAPLAGALRAIHQARSDLAEIEPGARSAIAAEYDLMRFRSTLSEFDAFTRRSPSRVRLLAAIARLLPDSASAVALRVDSTAVQLVFLAPRAALVLDRLERSSDIAMPQLVGPVTRELIGDRVLERATVRFRVR